MRRSLFLLTFLMTIFCSNLCITNISANDKKDKKSRDNFFPVARVVLTPVFLSQDAAFSFLGEGGPRSYRFNGTLGYIACEQHRFKVGGEYLGQRLKYRFRTGHEHHWVHQWATGGKYQYLFADDCCCQWLKSFELSGYYARANSKELKLGEEHHHHHDSDSDRSEFRRIAGARSWGVEAGTSIDTTWNCGTLLLAIDYDNVDYRKKRFHHHDKEISGVGGTIALHQPLWCNVELDFKYQYKRAYDYIEALFNWGTNFECGNLNLGVFVNHVFGKERLPCSTTVGGEIGFSFGIDNLFNNCCDPCATDCCFNDCNDLAAWVSEPAVYIPQVLAISDEERCFPPELITGGIPDQFFPTIGDPVLINLNNFFRFPKGAKVTFEVSGLPPGIIFDPSTGIISGLVTDVNAGPGRTISVTASDGCGSTDTSFTLNLGSA